MKKFIKSIKFVHVATVLTLFVGAVGVLFAEVRRIDTIDTAQKDTTVKIERVEDSIGLMNHKLDKIMADVHYLRGLNRVDQPRGPTRNVEKMRNMAHVKNKKAVYLLQARTSSRGH